MIHNSMRLGFAALAAAMSMGVAHAAPATANAPGQEKKVPPSNHDVYYNVCRGTSPECYAPNNGWPAMSASQQKRVLIYSRTAGPRHAVLGTAAPAGSGLNPPLQPNNTMQAKLIEWLAAEGIQADWTENPANFSLGNYGAVILASGNRDNLWDIAQTSPTTPMTNLRQAMRRGLGVVAIHNAFGANYNWPYYEGLLGNANFYDHGPNRPGTVNTIAADPTTAGLPASWAFVDEWYNLTPFPTNVKFLLSATVNGGGTGAATVRDFHPVAWCQYYDGGRVVATTLGHNTDSFNGTGGNAAGSDSFKKFIVASIKSVLSANQGEFCTQ